MPSQAKRSTASATSAIGGVVAEWSGGRGGHLRRRVVEVVESSRVVQSRPESSRVGLWICACRTVLSSCWLDAVGRLARKHADGQATRPPGRRHPFASGIQRSHPLLAIGRIHRPGVWLCSPKWLEGVRSWFWGTTSRKRTSAQCRVL